MCTRRSAVAATGLSRVTAMNARHMHLGDAAGAVKDCRACYRLDRCYGIIGVDPDCRRRQLGCTRLASAREGLDDDPRCPVRHDAAARGVGARAASALGWFLARRQGEHLALVRNVSGSFSVCDPANSVGCDAALRSTWIRNRRCTSFSRQRHRLVRRPSSDVLLLEGDAFSSADTAAIGDPMRECSATDAHTGRGPRTAPWRRHPIDLAQWRQIGLECSLVGRARIIAEDCRRRMVGCTIICRTACGQCR